MKQRHPHIDSDRILPPHATAWPDVQAEDAGLDYPVVPRRPVPGSARQAAQQLARGLAEAMMGMRDARQFAALLSPDNRHQFTALARCYHRTPVRLLRCHLVAEEADRVEGVILLDCAGKRLVAAAVCIQERDARWACTHLSILLSPATGSVTPGSGCVRGRS